MPASGRGRSDAARVTTAQKGGLQRSRSGKDRRPGDNETELFEFSLPLWCIEERGAALHAMERYR